MRKYREDLCCFEGNILSPMTSFDSNAGRGKKCKAIFCFSHNLPHFSLGNCFNKKDNIFLYICIFILFYLLYFILFYFSDSYLKTLARHY